jgi:hypothetical protein
MDRLRSAAHDGPPSIAISHHISCLPVARTVLHSQSPWLLKMDFLHSPCILVKITFSFHAICILAFHDGAFGRSCRGIEKVNKLNGGRRFMSATLVVDGISGRARARAPRTFQASLDIIVSPDPNLLTKQPVSPCCRGQALPRNRGFRNAATRRVDRVRRRTHHMRRS